MTTEIISDDLLDQLAEKAGTTEDLFGKDGLFKQLQARLINRMLDGELTDTLGYKRGDAKPNETDNHRNGHYSKTIETQSGPLAIQVPRDRHGDHEPQLIKKGMRRLPDFDAKVLSLYARGMTMREIQGHLKELYSTDVSPELISTVTDEVMDEVTAWQNQPLDAVYPIVWMDALHVKVRQDKRIINKAVYIALGLNMTGHKEVLGFWIGENEGAKFWLGILHEMKHRGLQDIFIACIDGLKGFPEAIEAVFPKAQVQECVVHMVRYCLNAATWADRKKVAADLRPVYTAATEEEAQLALDCFKEKWDNKYPIIAQTWQRHWTHLMGFLAFPEAIRKVIYTTNTIESLNRSIRKIIKNKSLFPNDTAVRKILYLALKNAATKWTMPIREWKLALSQFAILFDDRFPKDLS